MDSLLKINSNGDTMILTWNSNPSGDATIKELLSALKHTCEVRKKCLFKGEVIDGGKNSIKVRHNGKPISLDMKLNGLTFKKKKSPWDEDRTYLTSVIYILDSIES